MLIFYDVLLTLLSPLIYLIGLFDLPHRKITGIHYYKYRDRINVGDVILTKSNWAPINIFNPCKLKHGALYVGKIYNDEVCYVIESTRKGVVLTDLVSFLTSKDVVVICEIKKGRIILMEEIQRIALEFKGMPYDYIFSPDGKALYCFELCAKILIRIFPNISLKFKTMLREKVIYTPETFTDIAIFNIKIDSRNE